MTIKSISVKGFKSIFDEQTLNISPITVFSGANSGGKSSASQSLLLIKQTIESQYDPGDMLLYGPNVKFTSAEQVFSHRSSGVRKEKEFSLGITVSDGWTFKVIYGCSKKGAIEVKNVELLTESGGVLRYFQGSEHSYGDIKGILKYSDSDSEMDKHYLNFKGGSLYWRGMPGRCFPDLTLSMKLFEETSGRGIELRSLKYSQKIRQYVRNIIHIKGLRGSPERSYLATARTGGGYPGAFEEYIASIILHWQSSRSKNLEGLGEDLRTLGLTWKVKAVPIQGTHAEIRVGRLDAPAQGGANDLVSLADVGLGVSQVLPFLVALRAARKGQVIFVEQPEIHLHPKAQFKLAEVIVAAVKRGVGVWVETHSSILIRAIQTKIAQGLVERNQVSLNWFQRDSTTGGTSITSCVPDEYGRLGDWPADFDDVSLESDRAFLDAVAKARMVRNA